MKALVDVLADCAGDAQVLRHRGHVHDAELIEQIVTDIRASDAEGWLTWLTASEAMLRSGKHESWLRRNRLAWQEQGLARRDERRQWLYRQCIIPQRKHLSAIREDAKRAAQDAA